MQSYRMRHFVYTLLLDSCKWVCHSRSYSDGGLIIQFMGEKKMKAKFTAGLALTLGAAFLAFAADSSMTGYISDSQCGVKGADAKHADCAAKCVKEHGAKYVFVNDADKKVYAIDAQDKVVAHAGHHVTVTGTVSGDALKLGSVSMAK